MQKHNLSRMEMRRDAAARPDLTLEAMNRAPMANIATGMQIRAKDAEKRTVELSFSSELEYERWFGFEVLDHSDGSIDLSRMQNSAALLVDHDWKDQVGVVESVSIGADRMGRAVVRFGKSERAEEIYQDVLDGIRKNVSVGYRITEWEVTGERDGKDIVTVKAWQPYEISIVAVPADPSVGVGRTHEIPTGDARKENTQTSNVKSQSTPETKTGTERTMNIKVLRNAAGNLVRAEVDEHGSITRELETLEIAGADTRAHAASGQSAERKRSEAIIAMGEKFKAEKEATAAIRSGMSEADFQSQLLERFNSRTSRSLSEQFEDASIGMSDKEVRNFSFLRAVRALLPTASKADIKAAAFEFECSETAQKQYGKESKGILVPVEVLSRAFNAGGAANTPSGAQSGQYLQQNTVMSGSFIEMLRNRTTFMRLATVMGGLTGTVDIPKQTGGATAYWLGEGQNATEGTPSLGQISFSSKTVAAYTDITRKLMTQATPDAEGIVRRDLNNAMAQAIDLAAYYGSGTDNMPRGLANYNGINAVTFATGGQPTFNELVQMETEVAADNADIGQMGYVGHTRFRGHAKTHLKFSSAGSATIWEPGNTVNGYRTEITNQVNQADVFFGNFSDAILAMWGGLDITVDPYALSQSGGLRIVVFQDVDLNLRRVESICLGR